MRFLKFGLPALALMMSVSTASAAVYKCDLTTVARSGFLSKVSFLDLRKNNTEAVVLDGLIQDVYGKPIAATVKSLGKNAYRIRWEVKNIQTQSKTRVNAKFSARLNVQSGKVNVHGLLPSNNQEVNGRGSCAVQK